MRKVILNNLVTAYGEDLVKYMFAIPIDKELPVSEDDLEKETYNILTHHY